MTTPYDPSQPGAQQQYNQPYPTPPGQIPPNQMPPGQIPPQYQYAPSQPPADTFFSHLFNLDVTKIATPAVLKTAYILVFALCAINLVYDVFYDIWALVNSTQYGDVSLNYLAEIVPDVVRSAVILILSRLGLELFYTLTNKK